MKASGSTVSRTLVISPNWIGDAIMAQPLLTLLRRQQPDRPIDVLAPGWVAPVWRAMTEVDTVIESPFRHGELQLGERRKFARLLRERAYADAYILPNTLKFALIPWLASIPKRVGYKGEMRYGLINVMHHDDPAAPRPMVPFYAALAQTPVRGQPKLPPLPEPRLIIAPEATSETLKALALAETGPRIVFAPGAEFGPAKRWPAERYAELAKHILARRPDATILLLGSGKDKPACDDIVAAVPEARNLAGITSLSQAMALIAGADAVVTNDSGLMHIAAALQRPLVAVYGPTDPRHTPPLSTLAEVIWLHIECAPCQQRVCPLGHHRCMKEISAERVWQPLQRMLAAPSDQETAR